MTISIIDKEMPIVEWETYCHKPFIGYIAPNGDLIGFNKPFGESGHDGWNNFVTITFLRFVSYIIKENSTENNKNDKCNIETIDSLKYHSLKENVIRGMGFYLNKNSETFEEFLNELDSLLNSLLKYKPFNSKTSEFQYQILLFFKKAYSNKNFFESIGRKIEVTSEKDFMLANSWIDPYDFTKKHYVTHLKLELMQYFKDIAVSYLGYDSLERFGPNGELIKIPYNPSEHGSYFDPYSSYFCYTPRIITTSYPYINKRFYNFKVMNWSIHQIPKYSWNEQTLKFEEEPYYKYFYHNEEEEILEKEIQSIKRLVPPKDRYKYFI